MSSRFISPGSTVQQVALSSVLASASRAVDVTASGTTFGTGTDLLSSALTFNADGTSNYLVRVFCTEWRNNSTANCFAKLVLDTADGGFLGIFTSAIVNAGSVLHGQGIITTPAAGAHTVNVRLYVDAGTGTVFGSLAPILVTVQYL